MNKVKGKTTGTELEVKRFYIPGVIVESRCPKCGHLHKRDLGDDYLSYPVIGSKEKVHFYCEEDTDVENEYCDTEWEVEIILNLTVKLAE